MSKAVPTGSRQPSDDEIMRAIPPARRVRELRVGLFVILGLSGFFIVLFTMTNPATFRGRYTVLTQVEDAGGMRSGDAVTMRGVHIGRVRGFDLTGESGVVLSLEIERGWEIPVGSRTEVRSTGFLGGMVVSIVTGPGPGIRRAGNPPARGKRRGVRSMWSRVWRMRRPVCSPGSRGCFRTRRWRTRRPPCGRCGTFSTTQPT